MTPNGSYGMAAERVEKSEKLKNTNIKKAKKSDMSETIKSVIFLEGRKVCQFFSEKIKKSAHFFRKVKKSGNFSKWSKSLRIPVFFILPGFCSHGLGRGRQELRTTGSRGR